MENIKLLRTLFSMALMISLVSCELNDDENFPDPTYPDPIVEVGGVTELNLGVSQFVNIPNLSVEGAVGITSIRVSENGNVLDVQQFDGTSGLINTSFSYQIPQDWFDTSRVVNFTATDTQNNTGQISITVNVSDITPQYTIEDITLNGQPFKRITGTINFNETLDANNLWIISGEVNVSQQTTLTILEGTQIYAETSETRLLIDQLAFLDAQGTSTNPVVFNSLANAPGQSGDTSAGQWSGIGLTGSGGTDSSGTMRYVRVMYPGSNDDAIQLTNVGSGTVFEYIQVYRSPDNGFRINEGTINLRYLVATDGEDSGLRVDDGWIGACQFLVINSTGTDNHVEARDNANLLISNVTITGIGFNDTSEDPNGGGFRIRNGAASQIYNTVVTGVDRSLRFSNGSEATVQDGTSFFANSASFGNDEDDGTGFHSTADFFNPTDGDYIPSFNNSVTPFTITDSYVGTDTSNSTPAGILNPFFADVNYIGAVEVGNDWTVGWCVNIDGTLRN
ncbi:hypothetical protein [Winogradskyella sp.]|uniref:hypothetical protein n=1 Tax=Winogradskyella sp. TaxID=1883156 RepID=UPI003BA89B68